MLCNEKWKKNLKIKWKTNQIGFMSDIACSCWDINDNAAIWWVIKGPVLASIMVRIVHIPSLKTFDCKLLHGFVQVGKNNYTPYLLSFFALRSTLYSLLALL